MAFQFMNSIYDKAKKNVKTIAIPEVTNEYMIKAAAKQQQTESQISFWLEIRKM